MIKVILMSISATLLVVVFITSMFLNSILGVFGLASTSIETLNNLQESKQIIDKVKKRHKTKKSNMSKKFLKRSSRKITASAVSAASIGTAAVVITVMSLEMLDYCDDKKELQDNENILFNKTNSFNYSECMKEAQKDSSAMILSAKQAFPKMVANSWDSTKNISGSAWEATKATSVQAWLSTKTIGSDTWHSVSDTTKHMSSSMINWATAESN